MQRPDSNDRRTDRQLTPAECERLSQATQDLPYQLTVTDAEQLEEELHGKPLDYDTLTDAILAMLRRIAEMKTDKVKVLDALDDCAEDLRAPLLRDLDQLNRDIAATEQRLAAYRRQQGQQN